MTVFREVKHGLFTFNAPPFNSMYFLSLLAVHELHGRSLRWLKLHVYRATLVQELKPLDLQKWFRFREWFSNFISLRCQRAVLLDNFFFFSDEAWFHRIGYIIAKNYRFWCSENWNVFRETSLHPEKNGVWCALSRIRIIGPTFFTLMVNANTYQDIITLFISLLEWTERDCWFQQDGDSAHTAGEMLQFLWEFFEEWLVSKGLWPPRSLDLPPCYFFLWGYLKNRVFQNEIPKIE